jgi:hypothetical protein
VTSSLALLLGTSLSALVFVLCGALWDRLMGLDRGGAVTVLRLFAGWLTGTLLCGIVAPALSDSLVIVLIVSTLFSVLVYNGFRLIARLRRALLQQDHVFDEILLLAEQIRNRRIVEFYNRLAMHCERLGRETRMMVRDYHFHRELDRE